MAVPKDYLIKNKHGDAKRIETRIELLSVEHLDEVLRLNRLIYKLLPNQQVLSLDTYEEMYEDLVRDGVVLGVFDDNNRIIAYRYASFPGLEDRNLAYDFDFPVELEKVCQLETTIVHPDYRGNNLQNKLVKITIDIAKERGYTDLTCTVSPYNYYSLKNIMKNDMKIRALKPKYQDLVRFVLHGKIHDFDYGEKIDVINTHMEDIDRQKNLLKNGYLGDKLFENRTIDYVKYK